MTTCGVWCPTTQLPMTLPCRPPMYSSSAAHGTIRCLVSHSSSAHDAIRRLVSHSSAARDAIRHPLSSGSAVHDAIRRQMSRSSAACDTISRLMSRTAAANDVTSQLVSRNSTVLHVIRLKQSLYCKNTDMLSAWFLFHVLCPIVHLMHHNSR